MTLVGYLPLVVAAAVVAVVPLASVDRRVDTHLTRVARRYFSRYVPAEAPERTRRLRAAYVDETYRSYAAKTYLVTVLAGLAGAIVGVYVVGGVLVVLPAVGEFVNELPNAMANALGRPELDPDLTEREVFAVLSVGGVVVGALVAGGAYWYRWESPRNRAEVRRRGINEGLPRTVAFVYALSRGGVAVPEVLRTLARNRAVYGHGADEIAVAVREMDLFGSDIITAVRRVSERTPSEQFKTFTENFASVLQSGQDLSGFLHDQYERYREEAQERQDEVLELLATIAEAYVTVLVAGTLFLMTILVVFGLTTTNTLGFLKLLAYLMVPLGNLLFVVYLDGKLDLLGVARGTDTSGLAAAISDERWSAEDAARPDERASDVGAAATTGQSTDGSTVASGAGRGGSTPPRSDGGTAASTEKKAASRRETRAGDDRARDRRQLALYDSLSAVKRVVGRPVETVLRRPTALLYLTVPLALLWVAVRAPAAVSTGSVQVRILDDILVQAVLFVVGTFAVAWELYSRRIRRMEAQLPELLGRLASLNQAGMSVVESLERVRESDLGVLSEEVDRVWRDVQYGANVDDALRRFGLRVRTTATTRVVTLLTNALRASGNVAPVLRIAGEQAASELRLRRRRRQQMLTYLVVIYISFLVFLVIIVAIHEVLVPSLPTDVPTPTQEQTRRLGVNAAAFSRFGEVDKAAYTLVFFHTALVQAVLSGFIGGQLGEGALKDGAKHAAVLLAVAYVAFLLLSSPVAQVTFDDQTATGDAVVVDSVSASDGGFVVVRQRTPDGEVVGHSRYLEAGEHENVRVELESTYTREMRLYASVHLDTNDNGQFDFEAGGETDGPYTESGRVVTDSATVTRGGDTAGSLSSRVDGVGVQSGEGRLARLGPVPTADSTAI